MELYDQIKAQINETLQETIINTMKKCSIRYNLNSSEDYRYVTIFATNKDIALPKKLRTKARLAKPQIDILYVRTRNFDYNTVSSFSFKQANPDNELSHINFLWADLEDQTEFADIRARIISWTREIFAALSNLYKDKYGIRLYMMPLEFYILNYNEMYVSKLPAFENLTFLSEAYNPNSKATEGTEIYLKNEHFLEDQTEIANSISKISLFNKFNDGQK